MKTNAIIAAALSGVLLTACAGTTDIPTQTAASETTTTIGTTISAVATTTTTVTTETTAETTTTESTTEFTIPELPEITITTATTVTAETTSTTSDSVTAASSAASEPQTTAATVGKAFTFEAETVTAAAGAKKIPFTVKLHNNPGITLASLTMSYGALLPNGDAKTNNAQYTEGIKTGGVTTCMYNNETQLMAFAVMAQSDFSENGDLFTVYFDLPADAKSGAEYPVTLKVSSCTNHADKKYTPETVNGVIKVK